ncbi:MAG: hypothetical protein ACLQNE_14725 [Thermoguttaceae bacterium]
MRRNEKAWTLILVAAATVLAVTFASAVSIWANPSTVPNNNKVLCYNPTNGVADCTKVAGETNCNSSIFYQINNFPDGYKPGGDKSQTKQVQADCWRSASCWWNATPEGGLCNAPLDSSYSKWIAAAETVTDPNGEGG